MLKVNNKNTRTTPVTVSTYCSGNFSVNFEHILHLFYVSIVGFDQVNNSWVKTSNLNVNNNNDYIVKI